MNDHYDKELPILAELERDVTRAAELALGRSGGARPLGAEPMHGGRVRRPATRRGGRVVRRALLLVALVLLVGATALAATGAFDGGDSDTAVRGAALDAAHGAAGGGYRLVIHTHGRTLCQVLVVQNGVASKCRPAPSGEQVQPLSELGTNRRFVFGLAGPRERSVLVRVGDRQLRVPTHPIDAEAARASGIDPHVRVFVAAFPPARGTASQPPAFVAGRVDCSLTTVPVAACETP